MKRWYIKELSKLTKVSVRTLHHYDEIGLLKPSERLPNGYRVYTEADLLKLQQIIALKFGFTLSQIKAIMEKQFTNIDYLHAQAALLLNEISRLQAAHRMLEVLISDIKNTGSVKWNTVMEIIEMYHMKKELRQSWTGMVYTDEEVKQFTELSQKYSGKKIDDYQKEHHDRWQELISRVENNLDQDPTGPFGQQLAKDLKTLLDEVYGENKELKEAIWNAFKSEQTDSPFSKKAMEWIDKAHKSLESKSE